MLQAEEELDQIIQQVLRDYENEMEGRHILLNVGKENPPSYERKTPKFIERVLANQQVSPEIQATLEKLREQK
jgi:signal transduction histidine kinase